MKKLIIILSFLLVFSLQLVNTEDSHAAAKLTIWGPFSYLLGPDLKEGYGEVNKFQFINLGIQGIFKVSPGFGVGIQTGYFTDYKVDSDGVDITATDIPILGVIEIPLAVIDIQAGLGLHMRTIKAESSGGGTSISVEKDATPLGFFGGISYPIHVFTYNKCTINGSITLCTRR